MELADMLLEFGRARVALRRARRLVDQAHARTAGTLDDDPRADAGLGLALARVVRAEARALSAGDQVRRAGFTTAA